MSVEQSGNGAAVKSWLAFAAMKAAAEIIAITASAPDYIRTALEQPSQVDLAIVARLADLLTPPVARMIDDGFARD